MEIMNKINLLRAQINEMAHTDNISLCAQEMVQLSMELDELINLYYKFGEYDEGKL